MALQQLGPRYAPVGHQQTAFPSRHNRRHARIPLQIGKQRYPPRWTQPSPTSRFPSKRRPLSWQLTETTISSHLSSRRRVGVLVLSRLSTPWPLASHHATLYFLLSTNSHFYPWGVAFSSFGSDISKRGRVWQCSKGPGQKGGESITGRRRGPGPHMRGWRAVCFAHRLV